MRVYTAITTWRVQPVLSLALSDVAYVYCQVPKTYYCGCLDDELSFALEEKGNTLPTYATGSGLPCGSQVSMEV